MVCLGCPLSKRQYDYVLHVFIFVLHFTANAATHATHGAIEPVVNQAVDGPVHRRAPVLAFGFKAGMAFVRHVAFDHHRKATGVRPGAQVRFQVLFAGAVDGGPEVGGDLPVVPAKQVLFGECVVNGCSVLHLYDDSVNASGYVLVCSHVYPGWLIVA